MSLRALFLLIVGVIIAVFVSLNWAAMLVPTDLNLVVAHVHAPLGLVLLGLMAILCMIFLGLLAVVQTNVLMETRKQSKELAAMRERVENEENSRISELRGQIESSFTRLSDTIANAARENMARIDRAEIGLREAPLGGLSAAEAKILDRIAQLESSLQRVKTF